MGNERFIILECNGDYTLEDFNGKVYEKGKALIQIDQENLLLLPTFSDTFSIKLRDIIDIKSFEYKVEITLVSSERVIIFNLGYKFEDFIRILSRVRNELLLKDFLMNESIKKSNIEAQISYIDENNNEKLKGRCEIDLFETGFVIKPEKGDIVRIPYSDISNIIDEDLKLSIITEWGEKILLSHLGKELDSFKKNLSELMNELMLKVQSHLKELLPQLDSSLIRKLSRIMKEGRCAKREDIESISTEIWQNLEKKIIISSINEEYNFLKNHSVGEKICIGLKRGLMGNLTGEYIWFLIPIFRTDDNKGGNVVAMESISEEEQGKATYFFKVVNRKEFKQIEKEEFKEKLDKFIKDLNRCMIAINFRREPIYLPDEKLLQNQYKKYLYSIKKIPSLQKLRNNFIGRVIHRSFEQWKEDVISLLRFNISTVDEYLKWEK